ncbi:MAG: hypothetical protein CSA95_08325 [Bacteroidetes bacterium]|nr:MAG: hypothetical protein CSA95_08325 [Bacteroidota bacterium]
MNRVILIAALLIPVWLHAQKRDTTTVPSQRISSLEAQIDSLRNRVIVMDSEIQALKQGVTKGKTDIEEMLAIFSTSDTGEVQFETRSRYKRIDELLKKIQQRPGQLIFNGNVTNINQFTLKNKETKTFGTGSFDIFATTSFGKGTLLFIDLEAIGGDGPDLHAPTFSGLNGDAGSTQSPDGIDRLNVLEAWGEFTMFKEILTVTIGKIDLTNYFDNNAYANDETTQFISGSFINNSSFAVPSNAPGVHFRTTFFKRYHLQVGLSSQRNEGVNLFNNLYKIAGLGFTFAPDSDFEANIRMYGYQVPAARNDYGFGVSLDKVFFNKFNVFGRYGLNHDSVASYWGIRSSWSTGFRFIQTIGEQAFAIGIAYGENSPSNPSLKDEKIAEFYIIRKLNKWVHLSPHIQYVWNHRGSHEEFMVFGLRTHFNF